MSHLTKVLFNTLLTQQVNRFTTFNPKSNISYKQISLLNKVCFFEGSFKSRGFKSGENDLPFSEYMKKSIIKFPYCKLPKYNQKFSQQKQLSSEEFESLVAFSSLFVVNEANKQKQLKEMAEILLKQQFQSLVYDKLTGKQIFSLYYIKKLPQIVNSLNQDDISDDKAAYFLQVLINLIPTPQIKDCVQKIKEQKMATKNIHIQSLYVKLLLRHNLSYIHIVDKLFRSFNKIVEDNQLSQNQNVMKLQAAKTMLSIEEFEDLLPENIKNACLNNIIENVINMQAFDHIMVIKHIYMSSTALCKQYMQKLTSQIMALHKKKKSDQLHVPLLLKVIKYRSKLHLDNKMFLDIINSYPEKFNTVFREKNINKEIFLSLTTKQATTNLNPQIRTEFSSYVNKVFSEYEVQNQIDEDDLIRNIKLILKYGQEIPKQQLNKVFNILIDNLYERIKHAASQELKYYVFLLSYTFNSQQLLRKTGLTQEVVEIYHNKCLVNPQAQYLSRMINIEYQLCRKQVQPSLRKNIFAYNYTNIELTSSVYSYLFYLMKKEKSKGSTEQKLNVINQLKKNIFKNLSNKNFSMKIIYTLIDVLDELKYNDKYMYMDIERAIGNNFEKALSNEKKKATELPLPKDIQFLKNKLSKNDKCSTKFQEFLSCCEKNYNLINDYINDYLQKAKNWEKIRENFKKNREKDVKKPQQKIKSDPSG